MQVEHLIIKGVYSMTEKEQAKIEEELEIASQHSYELGISEGLRISSSMILDKSIEFFKADNMSMALFLRNTSFDLKAESKKRHPGVK